MFGIEDSNLIMLNIYEFLLAACYYGPDLKLNDLEIVEQYRRRQSLLEVMAQNKCHRCPKLQEHYTLMRNQQQLKERVKQLKYELSDAALQQMPDFQQRIEVLQHVGYIDTDLVVQLKGRVACEINSSDELIATECLFDNQLDHLSPAEAVALLSALVFQQKEASKPLLTPRLAEAKDRYSQHRFYTGLNLLCFWEEEKCPP
jgi:antiviral helicase SKI2